MRRLIVSILVTAIFITLAFVNFDSASAKPKESAGNKEKKEEKSDKDKKRDEEKSASEKKQKCGPYCIHSGKKAPKIPGPTERTLKLDYRLHVSNIPENAQTAYAWIPMPRKTDYQTLISYKVSGNWKYEIVKDSRYGNSFILVNLLSNKNRKSPNAQVMVKYQVKRLSAQPIAKCKARYDYNKSEMERYLMPDNLVPIDGGIKQEAERIAGGERGEGFCIQANLIFDDIVATVKYDGSGFDITRGDAIRTMDTRTGNSADLNSLFVGETRSLEIPSRLVAGVTIPIGKKGEISVYHSWSEFFDLDLGWLPVDITNAIKEKDYRESYFGGLDSNRIEFSIGRDIILPKSKSVPVNFAIYPHVEIDGKIHKDIKYSISYQEIPGKGAKKSKTK